MRIGFVGLGSMGTPMARNLLSAGFAVSGFDINPEALVTLKMNGGDLASSAAEAAHGAALLILMVVNAAQAEAVLFEAGALAAMAPDGVVLLMATCPPGIVKALAARVRESGRSFVDCPVSGGTKGADTATLTLMAAADNATFDRVRLMLDTLGDKVFHVGTEAGQGAAVKAINQLLCGVHLAAAAEGLALAAKIGVDPDVILKILGGSSAASWMLNDRGPRMTQSNPPVSSAVDIFVKDLGIVLEAGRESKAALPLAAIAHQLFLAASGRGEGAVDDSQVIRSYAALNGPTGFK